RTSPTWVETERPACLRTTMHTPGRTEAPSATSASYTPGESSVSSRTPEPAPRDVHHLDARRPRLERGESHAPWRPSGVGRDAEQCQSSGNHSRPWPPVGRV